MKKGIKIMSLLIAVCLLAGCNSKEVVKKCFSNTKDVTNGYELESNYEIHAEGDVVKYVVTEETIVSENKEILDYFEDALKETYDKVNESYGGYDNKITKESNKIISKTKIDYSKMNLDQYVKDNSIMKNYVNSNNEITVEGATALYKQLGANCE